ncbi:alpha/beta fold hydrolase [Sphingomonas baiyangensis]|uniref:Alpha/beta hydrolase n=1 Tax=Sphingomonas baiyangensis TaxID=2572576 RepID=A0A4U1L7Z5_9SPHN|nr:alpha/beta hydrolase [Sphingomonas baiyangensis]TKD53071.1 alpha/beta hydrolase [Sphingomonas baiyangensis]
MAESRALQRSYPTDARMTRWHAPDGWDHRRFDWPVAPGTPPRGRILFQAGRGDMFEKYLESFAHWRACGWSVTSFDWRGQGGSGRCSPRAHCGHVERFADYHADLAAFWAMWRAEGDGPTIAIGHSMGGFLLLRGLVDGAVTPDGAVFVAPMLGLKGPLGPRLAARLARWMRALGDPARPAWKGNERPATTETRQSLLTRDTDRYEDELHWQQADRTLMTGPPSWNWVAEAFAGTLALADDPRLDAMRVPLLALVAEADGLVDARAALAILSKLPDARIERFGRETAHEILREADPVRDRALAAIDGFLDART